MEEMHYKEKISAFLNRELSADEHRVVGEHVLYCSKCRSEHDEIKLGADFAQNLKQASAPDKVWKDIVAVLDKNYILKARPNTNLFQWKKLSLGFVSIVTVLSVTLGIYLLVYDSAQSVRTSKEQTVPVAHKREAAWKVENITGKSKITNASENESLKIGSSLETDKNSRAKIDVADIGQVEVAPNSLVKLVNSTKSEHRLSLERGKLSALIFAPPRLFVVDTPSAAAVDLGCAYDLDVDEEGNSKLHVKSGYVSLEREGLESIVPAGAICYTKRGHGLGTPFSETASHAFQNELRKFDFHDGGRESLIKILNLAKPRDTLTLWHLISRVSKESRAGILKKVLSFSKLPDGVTREGILRLDKNMLEKLRFELENLWYE